MDWTPLIAAVAPNGATKTKADHSALPLTPEELARTAVQCLEAGAAMMHLHVRGADGGHTLSPDIYRQAIASIRRAVGDKLVIQATSESGGLYSPDEQMQAVRELKPEAVSLALRELIRGDTGERAVADFFHWLPRNGCVPQYILYTPEEVDRYRALLERDVIPDSPHWVLFVLGRYTGGRQSQAADLVPFLNQAVPFPWSMCAFGAAEHACATAAMSLGGHVRVGFENNVHLKDGSTAKDNAALVRQVAEAAGILNRPLMDADGVRDFFTQGGT